MMPPQNTDNPRRKVESAAWYKDGEYLRAARIQPAFRMTLLE